MLIDVVVIGGGPAGLAAALAARQAGAQVMILERDKALGGILQQCIHNGFGLHRFKEELTGPEYAQRYMDMVAQTDIKVRTEAMVLSLGEDGRTITAVTPQGMLHVSAGATILAMGCRERTRGAIRIPGTRPAGIYTAGAAQRLVNMEGVLPGKRAVILGSGDIGLIMARRLTWEGLKVPMVLEIMPYSSGLSRNRVQCLDDYGIPLRLSHTITQIHGKKRLESVTVARVDDKLEPISGTEELVDCDTLLLSVGLIPENELASGTGIRMDTATSGPMVDARRQTTLPGVFACGNALQVHDLVDYVSEEGETAGRAAAAFVRGEGVNDQSFTLTPGQGVRYTVPQFIQQADVPLTVYFRVSKPIRNGKVSVRCADRVLVQNTRRILTPGEMERLMIPVGALIDGPVQVLAQEG